jgi:hypothetical protein
MAKVVRVKVVNEQNEGVAGQQVSTSDMEVAEQLNTDDNGMVNLLIVSATVTIRVNGNTVYQGDVSGLKQEEVCTVAGKRL